MGTAVLVQFFSSTLNDILPQMVISMKSYVVRVMALIERFVCVLNMWNVLWRYHNLRQVCFKVCCSSFTSPQHLRSYQDRYWLMTVWTHYDFVSAAPLGNQAIYTMTQYLTQPHHPDIELTSPFPILVRLRTKLGSDKYQSFKCLIWLNWGSSS